MRLSSIGTGAALVALVLLVAAACGGSGSAGIADVDAAAESGAPENGTVDGGLDAGATDGAAPTDDAGCPATYTAATGSCQPSTLSSSDPVCVYPEGTCRCGPARCGGVVIPIDDDAATRLQWRCSAARTDGCPERDPDGQPCAMANQRCSYPSGCCTNFATCTEGRWVTRPGACPL